MENGKPKGLDEILAIDFAQIVAKIYGTILEEMDQEVIENAVARGTELVETLYAIILSIVQYDALAFKILYSEGIDCNLKIDVKISGSDSTDWSLSS
ncbi:MAG: hypothetical protein M1538_00295 [Candidatus Marsarchaeota archaeon]|jgi:hypothetical protein|nr:hypothetical protein [Candidatus Marsarchaeota archaeon]